MAKQFRTTETYSSPIDAAV